MAYKALDVARYIINYSNEKGYGVSNLKLQKLLYFVQAEFLAYSDEKKPCLNEDIEAWGFGPVVPCVYREFKQYGSNNIPSVKEYFEVSENWDVIKRKFTEKIIRMIKKIKKFTTFPVLTCSNGKKRVNINLHAEMESNQHSFQCKMQDMVMEVLLRRILYFL